MKKYGWFYWVGFFASHGRLQLHGSTEPMAADCCNRFQKCWWEMGGTTDSRQLFHAKLRLGDYRHWRYGDMRIRSSENQDNRSRWFSEQQCGPCVKREWKVSFDRRQTQRDRLEGRPKRHCSFMWIREVVSACLKLMLKTVKGSPIPPSSNPLGLRLRKMMIPSWFA